ncbi:hypothetical protein BGZ70_001622 [Mortierella alpina]|uniref:PH domain-containing protein n=1 Tax=Mortierella alpina TaxID=64518 RepID=A0A9P6JC38_MORAP|nr:hypothetical protein BGZ70_001622 [Mortierella alpina]
MPAALHQTLATADYGRVLYRQRPVFLNYKSILAAEAPSHNMEQALGQVTEEIINEEDGRITIDASPACSETTATTAIIPHTNYEADDPCYDSDAETPCEWASVSKGALQDGQVIKAGYLMKKGERLKIWKRKWFVLRTSKLAYYKDNKEYELLRIIDIRDVHRAAEVPVKHKSGVFVILTPRRTFTLQASDVSEMGDWVHAINQAKVHFEFTASSSDLDSNAGSTVQLGIPQPQYQQAQDQPHLSDDTRGDRQSMFGALLPKRQLHTTLSLGDPDLLGKGVPVLDKNGIASSPLQAPAPTTPTGSWPPAPLALDWLSSQPGSSRRTTGLSLVTTGTQAMRISNPSSPRMEQVHAGEGFVVGSFSSGQSHTGTTIHNTTASVPGTPSSPRNAGADFFSMATDHNLSSGEEDTGDDPSVLEAGRLASEMNAPASGIVTGEQLESKVVRQGYLLKFGNKYKTWRKKWFVLRGDKLTYYKNTKEYQPHGIIPLSTIIDCLQTDPVSKSKQYCLRIVTAKRSFVCCAPDEDTLLQWLDVLHVECDRVAQEAHKEDVAAHQAHLAQQDVHAPQQQLDGHDGDRDGDDDETNTSHMGRAARIKKNFHSTMPRHSRTKSKSGDSGTGIQVRKVMSLECAASPTGCTETVETAAAPTVTFKIPVIPSLQQQSTAIATDHHPL